MIGAWVRLPAGLGECPGQVEVCCGSPGDRDAGGRHSAKHSKGVNTPGSCCVGSIAPRPGHTKEPIGTSAGTPQAKQPNEDTVPTIRRQAD